MIERTDETIVAVSSAPGFGRLGIVRFSGRRAIEFGDQLADLAAPLSDLPGSARASGEVFIDDDLTVPAHFYLFRAPHSYTREDLVEIHTVGSPVVLEQVRKRVLAAGALPAEPGEFTARAFLSGAMDLARAEAVAGVIRAQSDAQLRAARLVMDGAVSKPLQQTTASLTELLALIEAGIDFAEEPIDFVTPGALRERLDDLSARLLGLIARAASAERLSPLPRILLFGAPNVGKSTLVNRLSGTDRAICAAASGTTRDILSAPVSLGSCDAILLDAAGVCTSEDELIAKARAMTTATAQRVDLVCIVVDATNLGDTHAAEVASKLDAPRFVIAINKCDLVTPEEADTAVSELTDEAGTPVRAVSARTGAGLDELRLCMADQLGAVAGTIGHDALLLSERQQQAIRDAIDAIERAVELAEHVHETNDCAELLAFELRAALDAIGAVTGEVTTDDLLAVIFSQFCIGK